MLRFALLAVAPLLLFAACGGDDDSPPEDTDAGDETATSSTSGNPDYPDDVDSNDDDDDASADDEIAVRAPLEADSVAEVEAPDIGKVRYTIVSILDPANELLGLGLELDPGFRLYAVEVKVEVLEDGEGEGAANTGWWTIQTDSGDSSEWIGTGSGRDLNYAELETGDERSGFMAFAIPEGDAVDFITVEPSIYVGYDVVFEAP